MARLLPRWTAAMACLWLWPPGAGAAPPQPPAATVAPPASAAIQFTEQPATAQTLALLRRGGLVLYLRHGYTDNTRPDRLPAVDLADCSTQRPLTQEGRQLAAMVGDALRRAQVPVGELHASPLCRARESAQAAFPALPLSLNQGLMYTANLTAEQKAPILAATRRLLSAPVPAGTNRMVVAHGPNLMDLIGHFPKEGALVVFRPQGRQGFEYLATIRPGQWPELLR